MIDFSKMITIAEKEYEEASALARAWRDAELRRADIQLLKVQDGVTGLGTQKAWRDYRQALRTWPEAENFPSVDSRPQAPDSTK